MEKVKDKDLQYVIGNLLRWGVWSSMAIALLGGAIYLYRHGQEIVNYPRFEEQDHDMLAILKDIFHGIAAGHGRSLIMLGIILLFATPVMRVVFSLIGFALEKDKLYVVITLIVLTIIFVSIQGGLG
ncbi:DUF1634 domain-containing protein [Chitinophaga pendula]|uniref:DUF1634 domain-containing protein n=1 Tax=Chitinophaga TaxID=79328 RepID=UPI000BB078F1|nr:MULTISPECIES: DUF1634 domain-containing protein [Chitinophaga]ASZ12522.1 hypothetical protein CK934_16940 [Chitinophaga sp. MD30]UCJ09874.1 DUF1634 domain-containing protein [Chitinophaga pendula]